MKGPGLRIDLDVRRVWRCAKCGKTVRTLVQVVAQRCGCSDAPWMTLQPPVKREPFRPPAREPLPETDAAPEQPVPASVSSGAPIIEAAEVAIVSAEPASAGISTEASRPVATTAPASPEPASAEPAAPASAATEDAPGSAAPDDFGAGLDTSSPEPPA